MKKVIFTVLIVTLALLAVTCDSDGFVVHDPVGAAPEGWVTLTIGASENSRARAMNAPNANAEINFYEVVFVNGNLIARDTNTADGSHGNGFTGGAWEVNIPIGDYNGIYAQAVLFAGHNDTDGTKTLLAVGTIDSDTYITLGSGPITFKLEAIESGVSLTFDDSSFKVNYNTPLTIPISPEVATLFGGTSTDPSYPAFFIPHKSTGIRASYRFVVPNSEYIILTASPTPESNEVNGNSKELLSVSASPGTPGNFPTGATFTLTMSTEGWEWVDPTTLGPTDPDPNLTSVSISVPVKAITVATDLGGGTGVDWFIRGGTSGAENVALDDGAGGTGGAVLLKLVGMTLNEIEATGP